MSKKLHVRTLKRKKLPYGRFHYVISLKRSHWQVFYALPNGEMIHTMRSSLRQVCQAPYRLDWETNRTASRVYTTLYLTDPMDLAMIKLTYPDAIRKIYKVSLEDSQQLC